MQYRELGTPRLLLRRPESSDALRLFRSVESDPEVARYLSWQPHIDVAESEQTLALRLDRIADQTEFSWILQRVGPPEAIGLISAWFGPEDAELGFVLSRSYWGSGLMTEAVAAVADWVFGGAGVKKLWATCDTENLASARVLEKAGFRPRGLFHRKVVRPNLGSKPRSCLLFESQRASD